MKDKGSDSQASQRELHDTRAELQSARLRIAKLESRLEEEPVKVEVIQRDKPKEKSPVISEVVKDQLLLVSFLIFYIGIISTHTYYAVFGIKYQFLDLPTFHIVYHGLILILDAPYLLLPYIVAVAWLALDGSRFLTKKISENARIPLTYILIVILLAGTYPLAKLAGKRQAEGDLHESTSTLPKIVNLELAKGEKYGLADNYRLLVVDSTYSIIFKPLEQGDDATLPNIKRFSKSEINLIETIR